MDDTVYELLPQMGASRLIFTWVSQEVRGKLRHFGKPNNAMRALHQRVNRELFGIIERTNRVSFESATGGLPGRSPEINAELHARSRYFYQVDLHNAYENVQQLKLAGALFALEPDLGDVLGIDYFLKFCCMHPTRGGLVTGAPLSPVLFNIYCALWLDRKIRALCHHEGMVYTRYIDDLTISSDKPISKRLRRSIRAVIEGLGFTPHRRKSAVLDLKCGPVTITGVVIWWGGKRSVTQTFVKKVEDVLAVPTSLMVEDDLSTLAGMLGHLKPYRGYLTTKNVPRLCIRIEQKIKNLRREIKDRVCVKKYTTPRLARGMKFPSELLDELRARIPIEKVVSSRVKMHKRSGGGEYVGLCPFHNEKTASFTVATKKKFYHCFGCGEHGDVFGFVMKTEGLTFPEAVRALAGRFNIPLSA